MGFMNASMDDDSDEEDDEDMRRVRTPPVPASPSKHAALAAATGAKSPSKGPYVPERLETPPPQYNNSQQRSSPQPASRSPPPAIAAPRPGYATSPVAALDQSVNGNLARPAPTAAPQGRAPPSGGHPNLRIAPPSSPGSPYANGTPSPSGSPHPLQPPITPITPVFARPQRTNTMDSAGSVGFSETKGLIMRGEGEETLIPRGRGQKGDQFWRRFSMVAKDPQEKRPSTWLTKAQGGAAGLSRWVWIVGIVLLICAAGGIALGVYMSEQASAHYRPDAVGGSANEAAASLSATAAAAGKTAKGAIGTTSTHHVSPTNTVARRAPHAQVTPAAGHAARNRHNVARLESELL